MRRILEDSHATPTEAERNGKDIIESLAFPGETEERERKEESSY